MLSATFTGVHGEGKIQLFEDLATALRRKGIRVHVAEIEGGYSSIQMRAESLGLSIEEETNDETQYYLAVASIESDFRNRHQALLENAQVLLSARSVADVLAYTLYLNDGQEKQLIINLLRHHIAAYPPDISFNPAPLPTNSKPKTTEDFRLRINKIFENVWNETKMNIVKVPVFASDDMDLNQMERVKFCSKMLMTKLGLKLT